VEESPVDAPLRTHELAVAPEIDVVHGDVENDLAARACFDRPPRREPGNLPITSAWIVTP
jgi:hypothetical protein